MFYIAYKRNSAARECQLPMKIKCGTGSIGQIIATSAEKQNRQETVSTINLINKNENEKDRETESLARSVMGVDVRSLHKRKYGADYKPYNVALGPKRIIFVCAKSLIFQASMLLLEYNKYLDRALSAEKNDEEIDDFDWKSARKRYSNAFVTLAARNVSITVTKFCYETIAMTMFTRRLADRLTKDSLKSVIRKLSKYSKFYACRNIFKTALWSSIPSNCSILTVDIMFNVSDYFVYRKMKYTSEEMTTWFSRKLILYSTGWVFSAAGFAIGSYINPNYVGTGMAALFEAAAFFGVSYLLPM